VRTKRPLSTRLFYGALVLGAITTYLVIINLLHLFMETSFGIFWLRKRPLLVLPLGVVGYISAGAMAVCSHRQRKAEDEWVQHEAALETHVQLLHLLYLSDNLRQNHFASEQTAVPGPAAAAAPVVFAMNAQKPGQQNVSATVFADGSVEWTNGLRAVHVSEAYF
jgi:hypothetical protein